MRVVPTALFAMAALLLLVSSLRFGPLTRSRPAATQGHEPPPLLSATTQGHEPPPLLSAASSVPSPPPPPPPPIPAHATAKCGDHVCQPSESVATCPSDCPGITTSAVCGEEPHSDPAGEAVAWGSAPEHRVQSAAECCDRCLAHAKDPKNSKKPCNSWVFCYMPQCWSLDNGNTHTFGECWLKWQVDPRHALFGQRGQYTARFRDRYRSLHLTGKMPDGSPRNLSVPTHVPWTGGVIDARVSSPAVTWETDLEGLMTSSAGERIVPWRAWESRAQNLARGVKAEQMPR